MAINFLKYKKKTVYLFGVEDECVGIDVFLLLNFYRKNNFLSVVGYLLIIGNLKIHGERDDDDVY